MDRIKTYLRPISIVFMFLGFFLLMYEIIELYSHAKSLASIPKGLLGLISYMPITFDYVFLWLVLFLVGVNYWIGKKFFLGLLQILLSLIIFKIGGSLYWTLFSYYSSTFLIFYQVVLLGIIVLLLMCIDFSSLIDSKPSIYTKIGFIIASILSCYLMYYLENTFYEIV